MTRGAQAAERALASVGNRVAAIGVTCGLSARYVEGFIRTARAAPHLLCSAIVGFNPASASKIELFQEGGPPDTYLLNPAIGPEALTGSVRLKCGTATLAILFALLSDGGARTGGDRGAPIGFQQRHRAAEAFAWVPRRGGWVRGTVVLFGRSPDTPWTRQFRCSLPV